MNIVLTGFMASGKTEISKAIAKNSQYKMIDTDDVIVEAAGMSINDIFAKMGEAEFRKLESEAIKRVSELDGYVIATGGGVVLNPENIEVLRKNGVIVNLSPDFSVIAVRLESARKGRPLLQNQNIDEVRQRFELRKPFYDNCDFSVKIINGRTPKSYAIEILDMCSLNKG